MESCEVKAEPGRNLVIRHQWRFVAVMDGEVAAKSPPFWSSSGPGPHKGGSEQAVLRDFLHWLATQGWRPRGSGEASTRGSRWYAHRLYRDRPAPRG